MPDQRSLWKFFGFCFVFFAIVMFCIVAGGYTSFYRAQNRIEATKTYLTDACQERLALFSGLIEMTQNRLPRISTMEIQATTETAGQILQQVMPKEIRIEGDLAKDFEASQAQLTNYIKEVFTQLDTASDKKDSQRFDKLKNQFILAQNNLFVSEKRYNDEVVYYNTRKTAFFTSFIARLFGFDKINYAELSKEPFLPAPELFAPKTS